ncbi:MAG: YXWGXW repeat-containing protein [Bryobacterales bacterium]|nr:YXWGXW repeat-containing protein [Bryobacterales bacterium]
MNRKWLLTPVLLLSGLLTACGGYAGYGYGYRVPPPPPPRYGPVGYAPGPGFVWMDGFWNLHGSSWNWSPGRWVRPPRARSYWVPPRWERQNRGWKFHSGHWRHR